MFPQSGGIVGIWFSVFLSFRFIAQAIAMKAVFGDATSGTIDRLGDAISIMEDKVGELKGKVINKAANEDPSKIVNQPELKGPTDETREEVNQEVNGEMKNKLKNLQVKLPDNKGQKEEQKPNNPTKLNLQNLKGK